MSLLDSSARCSVRWFCFFFIVWSPAKRLARSRPILLPRQSKLQCHADEKTRVQLLTIGTTALVTAAVTTFARNFISGEKKIKHRIAQRYGISDPQFERSISQLIGRQFLRETSSSAPEWRRDFPGDAQGDRGSRTKYHFRDVYYKGRDRAKIRGRASEKARRGVKVHVLMDGIGCNCVNGSAFCAKWKTREWKWRSIASDESRPREPSDASKVTRDRW